MPQRAARRATAPISGPPATPCKVSARRAAPVAAVV
jgi:hypothetical protein